MKESVPGRHPGALENQTPSGSLLVSAPDLQALHLRRLAVGLAVGVALGMLGIEESRGLATGTVIGESSIRELLRIGCQWWIEKVPPHGQDDVKLTVSPPVPMVNARSE